MALKATSLGPKGSAASPAPSPTQLPRPSGPTERRISGSSNSIWRASIVPLRSGVIESQSVKVLTRSRAVLKRPLASAMRTFSTLT